MHGRSYIPNYIPGMSSYLQARGEGCQIFFFWGYYEDERGGTMGGGGGGGEGS